MSVVDREAAFRALYNAENLEKLLAEVVRAVNAYDRTVDHAKYAHGEDCARCKIVEALPEWARADVRERH